jgi:hypothetical protein
MLSLYEDNVRLAAPPARAWRRNRCGARATANQNRSGSDPLRSCRGCHEFRSDRVRDRVVQDALDDNPSGRIH